MNFLLIFVLLTVFAGGTTMADFADLRRGLFRPKLNDNLALGGSGDREEGIATQREGWSWLKDKYKTFKFRSIF